MKPSAPLLLIDVDGVISLFGFDQTEPPEGRFTFVDGLPHYLSGSAAGHLDRLHTTFECVWCTGWEDRADGHLPHLLGSPAGWPYIAFRDRPEDDAHWKLRGIDAFAGPDRTLAWIDDAHDDRCRAWAEARPGRTLLVGTETAVGLTPEHVELLEGWARNLSRPA